MTDMTDLRDYDITVAMDQDPAGKNWVAWTWAVHLRGYGVRVDSGTGYGPSDALGRGIQAARNHRARQDPLLCD